MSTSRDTDDRNQDLSASAGEPPFEGDGADGGPRKSPAAGPDSRINGLQRTLFDDVSTALMRRAEERYVRRLSGEQQRRGIAELLSFVSVRAPGEIKVRAYVAHDAGVDPNEELVALETCMDDQPFIIDTIKLAFSELALPIAHAVTMVLPIQRDEQGRLLTLRGEDARGRSESVTRFLLVRGKDLALREKLVQEVRSRLEMARSVVGAYLRLKKLTGEINNEYQYLAQISPRQRQIFMDASEFLAWMLEDNFVFLGASFYGPELRSEQGLGAASLLTQRGDVSVTVAEHFFSPGSFKPERVNDSDLVRFRTSTVDSKIHRAGKVSDVLIRRFDDSGRPAGGVVMHGLLTLKATKAQGGGIPMISRRLDQVLKEEEAVPDSHNWRSIRKAFDALPAEFLLEAPTTGQRDLVVTASRTDAGAKEAIVHVAVDSERHAVFAFVIVPQDVFTDGLRESLEAALIEGTQATYSTHRVSVGFGRGIGLYFYLAGCDLAEVVPEELKADLLALCTPWLEQLGRALRSSYDPETALRLQAYFASAFPEAYQRSTSLERAMRDVELLDKALVSDEMRFDLYQEPADLAAQTVRLTLYHKGSLFLSDVLPILDHFGFRVIDQDGLSLAFEDGVRMAIDTFRISLDGAPEIGVALLEQKSALIEGLRAVFRGDFLSDPLNRLMVRPGLRWDEVDLLRAYLGYALQIRPTLAREAVQRVLAGRPEVTRALVDLFHAHFGVNTDPRGNFASEAQANESLIARAGRTEAARERLRERLRQVQDSTEDRVLRAFANLLEATVRTNFFRRDRKCHYISFKLDCSRLEVCPEPRPLFEIFVHSAHVEGVHLRGGKIARGGLRWSDRLDDYRTEVFGLMRTQMVKNVLIVPVGAKGGFIIKAMPAHEDRRAYADRMYEIFIRGLLDVTDNIVDGKPVAPSGVVCHDDPDPYLVVAADKGTAHLSDTANRISQEYGHWLQDAFASGGSAGYDHKLYAITARGAWACTRHRFSFLGIDPEKDVIRVVGVGDMSGDVFGNGMLLSRTMKLVGAFDHRHVFLDPDPDPEISFQERQRLFNLPRSSWADYKRDAMSAGAGVFSRKDKEIPLSPECQRLLGVEESALPPEAVIKRLLTLEADLLWNGGIGTYIKASDEDHVAVGDRVNDDLRVDGKEVRAKVIGEGGNLGVTQKGRVEYARLGGGGQGGRIDTDAVDNSGGVDLSDHEVNLKILLQPQVAQGALTIAERNRLLRDIADEVCQKVIENNNSHALSITLDELRSRHDPLSFDRAGRFLKERGHEIPRNERIPTLADLNQRGIKHGYYRPELSRISAYIKMYVQTELLRSDPLRFPDNERLLNEYFPQAVTRRFHEAIEHHLLVRELLSTIRTNEIVKFAGATFFSDLVVETDRSVTDVALAYTIACHYLGAASLRQQVLTHPEIRGEVRYHALIPVEDALREATSWLLHFLPSDLLWRRATLLGRRVKPTSARSKTSGAVEYANAVAALREHLPSSAPNAQRRVEQDASRLREQGVPEALSHELGLCNQWAKSFPIAELAERTGHVVADVARVYLTVGQKTRLNALVLRIGRQPAGDVWEALALRSLRASLLKLLFDFAQKILVARANVDEVLERYPAFLSVAQEISHTQPDPDAPVPVAVLVVIAEKLRYTLERVHLEGSKL